jgi:hypothetical protein
VLLVAFACCATAAAQDVKIELVNFGVGDAARPGGWIGLRIAATSTSADVRKIEVVVESPNADNDVVENARIMTISGQRLERWVYLRLPPNSSAQSVVNDAVYLVRVFDVDENNRRIAEVASARVNGQSALTATTPVDQLIDLFMVVGDIGLGLDAYAGRGRNGGGMLPSLNSAALTVKGMSPRDFPDQWQGLDQYQVIAWADPRRSPAQLDSSQADAIREWIRRGGTFVVCVAGPGAADAWYPASGQGHPLSELLPSKPPARIDGVPLRTLLPILSKSDTLLNQNFSTDIATFDVRTIDRGFRPLVALPAIKDPRTGFAVPRPDTLDGVVLGVQRNFGFGQVVVLGLDLDTIAKSGVQRGGLPQADIFWNRVLGRRGDTPTPEEFNQLETANRVALGIPNTSALGSGDTIATFIGMSGSAAIGILSAAALFGAYWLLSGPIGFAGLKHFRRHKFSWLLFVVFAFVFTGIAWIGGAVLGQTTPSLKHLTVVDQLAIDPSSTDPSAGAPQQRAAIWFSGFLPGYAPSRVTVGSTEGANIDGNALASWSKPPSGTGASFPNRDRYRVSYDRQHDQRVPSRATAADFVARWRGTIDPSWGETISMMQPVRLDIETLGTMQSMRLSGVLKHGLPATLEQVKVILVTPYRTMLPSLVRGNPLPLPAPNSAAPPLYGLLAQLPQGGLWAPGKPLDLSQIFPAEDMQARLGRRFDLQTNLKQLYQAPISQQLMLGVAGEQMSLDARRRYLESLSFYSMLEPPEWIQAIGTTPVDTARAEREHARELDLGPWFTRPCLIIIGYLDEAPTPVPISVNGAPVESEGTVLYRWICPLDDPRTFDFAIPDLVLLDPATPAVPETPAVDGEARPDAPAAPATGLGSPRLVPNAGPSAAPAKRQPGSSPPVNPPKPPAGSG